MNNATEFTFPLSGFTYGTRTNIEARILNNKDAALLVLAANGGVMKVGDIKCLLRGWRPFGDTPTRGPRYAQGELDFTYLFNLYYGHISRDYNSTRPRGHYSSGAYMWRPRHGYAAISALGRARLNALVIQASQYGINLENEVVATTAQCAA